MKLPTRGRLNDIGVSDRAVVVSAGKQTVLYSEDAGDSWQLIKLQQMKKTHWLQHIHHLPGGFLAAEVNTDNLWFSADGRQWELVEQSERPHWVFATAATDGLVFETGDGRTIRSDDEGRTWHREPISEVFRALAVGKACLWAATRSRLYKRGC